MGSLLQELLVSAPQPAIQTNLAGADVLDGSLEVPNYPMHTEIQLRAYRLWQTPLRHGLDLMEPPTKIGSWRNLSFQMDPPILQNRNQKPLSEYTLQSAISALDLAGRGIAQNPPGSHITVVEAVAGKPNLPADTVVVVWNEHEYAVFTIDLQTKAMDLA